jgi:hypothetical protein
MNILKEISIINPCFLVFSNYSKFIIVGTGHKDGSTHVYET